MVFIEWHLIITISFISLVIMIWFRIRIILGGTLMKVMPPRKKWSLILGAISALISAMNLIILIRQIPGGASPEWVMEYYRQQMVMTASTAAVALAGIAGSALDGRVRREGIYLGRIYTWDQILEYRTEGTVVYISTTRTDWRGRPKQLKWDLHDRFAVRELAAILESQGISRQQ